MSANQLNLLAFNKPEIRTLHLTWFAFFLSFMVWFAHAPLMMVIRDAMHLTEQEVKILLILNISLTIPARIVVGMLVDKYGPKQMFSSILILGGLISIGFAFTQTYQQLAIVRFLSGFVGAGFVVGIRMISEWFPARQTGIAQGIYGGWGNFGSAGAALLLPSVALYFGAENGWRYAIAITGAVAVVYGCIYYFSVSNTPKGSTYFKPKNGCHGSNQQGGFAVVHPDEYSYVPCLKCIDLEVISTNALDRCKRCVHNLCSSVCFVCLSGVENHSGKFFDIQARST